MANIGLQEIVLVLNIIQETSPSKVCMSVPLIVFELLITFFILLLIAKFQVFIYS